MSTKTNIDNLPPEVITALYKTIRKEQASEVSNKLSIGENHVDVLVRISGTLKKGPDFTQRVVAKAQPWDIIAVLMSKLNGVTIDSVVKEALKVDPDKVTEVKKGAQEAMDEIKAPTSTLMNGRVSPYLSVEVVN
jgi:hypothetical protein